MLSATRLVTRKETLAPALPEVEGLEALYRGERLTLRRGQHIMVVGRPGSQKSGLALWMVAQMGLPTLYFGADMSAADTARRLLPMEHGKPFGSCPKDSSFSHLRFAFGAPITWEGIIANLNAWVLAEGRYPEIIVLDNLQDFAGSVSGYAEQMDVSAGITALCRATGITVFVLHHASNKTPDAERFPHEAPAQRDVKNNLSEKPEVMISVGFNGEPLGNSDIHLLSIAVLKNRGGSADTSARRQHKFYVRPELSRIFSTEKDAIANKTKWEVSEDEINWD